MKKFRNEDPVASGKGQLKYNKQVNVLFFRSSLVRIKINQNELLKIETLLFSILDAAPHGISIRRLQLGYCKVWTS